MEPRFGHDFSQVRLHTDGGAAESARAVNALAYTVGRDVVFGMGQYAPNTTKGRRLLIHELVHVVQQKDFSEKATSELNLSEPNSFYEQEAVHKAESVMPGLRKPNVNVLPHMAVALIQRQESGGSPSLELEKLAEAAAHTQEPHLYRVAEAIAQLEEAKRLATTNPPNLTKSKAIVSSVEAWMATVVTTDKIMRRQQGFDIKYSLNVLDIFSRSALEAVRILRTDISLSISNNPNRPMSMGTWNYNINFVKVAREHLESLADERVSFELAEATKLPPVPTRLTNLTSAQMQVLAWLNKYRKIIEDAERKHHINRLAIAGAIAWEGLENVRSQSIRGVGPGKVHVSGFLGEAVAEQGERMGALPQRTTEERKAILQTPQGSVDYIATIMEVIANYAEVYGFNARCDAPLLADVYQSRDMNAWETLLLKKSKKTPSEPLVVGNPMGFWVRNHLAYLKEAVGETECSEEQWHLLPTKKEFEK